MTHVSRRTIDGQSGPRHIFETFTRPGFVRAGAVVQMSSDDRVESLYLNSSEYGTVEIDASGALTCHSWETEDQAKSGSYLSRRFPVILHNGSESSSYALQVVEDVAALTGRGDLLELAQGLLGGDRALRFLP